MLPGMKGGPLAPYACDPARSRGRRYPEANAPTRNAFQRMYDMILSYGTDSYTDFKKNIVRYKFFSDPIDNGKDAIFGLDVQLMKLVNEAPIDDLGALFAQYNQAVEDAVALGVLIGSLVAGQTFYNFTLDNIRQFGALKAMGVRVVPPAATDGNVTWRSPSSMRRVHHCFMPPISADSKTSNLKVS